MCTVTRKTGCIRAVHRFLMKRLAGRPIAIRTSWRSIPKDHGPLIKTSVVQYKKRQPSNVGAFMKGLIETRTDREILDMYSDLDGLSEEIKQKLIGLRRSYPHPDYLDRIEQRRLVFFIGEYRKRGKFSDDGLPPKPEPPTKQVPPPPGKTIFCRLN